ncbi:WXG100 family type VII secretion target [Nocardia alni]|uniref:WXG100 family type VII secretion target n=1 Tax=Nocardia alni TaxID=2815723 RepID=UPI001C242F0B|nr:hypothetical protein [Nocardia alni]
MAAAALTMADPQAMQGAANQTQYFHGELQAHLNGLTACQEEFAGHLKGVTGTALQNSLNTALSTGNDLASFLQSILTQLSTAGTQFDASDQEAKGMVAGAGADGNSGESTSPTGALKVDLNSWG